MKLKDYPELAGLIIEQVIIIGALIVTAAAALEMMGK